ncbi:DUF6350 family protein [Pseudofrankia asymbiotica]|uniref:Uncharacterized protein n=1 Tax=Pseudofrankia asymbiotica TaxID=1834516 RepID=A0A1V2II52_9ACTN|nr:DUF6350 family protein [Pseudofrankia asymbiotica]ONH32111.1 hypothetical protein BL253_06350 [Pseudofrankia asymbiotica]
MAHPVASRGAAALRLTRLARLAHAFGVALPGPAVTCAAGLVAVQLLVLVVWGADTRSSAGAGAALRIGADLWLLAHGATLRLPDGDVRVLPLGLAALPVLLAALSGYRLAAARAGGAASRVPREVDVAAGLAGRVGSGLRSRIPSLSGFAPLSAGSGARTTPPRRRVRPHRVFLDIVAVVFAQTALVCVVCWAASSPMARPVPGSAALGAAGLSGLGATIGVLAGHRRLGTAWRRVPAMLRVPLAGGLAATAALVAIGALGLCVLLLVRAGSVSGAASGLDPGPVGGVGLVAVQLVLLPNLVIWACCYALGIGFAAGPTATVSPTSAAPTTLPDLPVLRLLPSDALPGWAWLVLAVVPLAAGTALALSVRRAIPGATLLGRLGMVLTGAAACALLVGLLTALSGGGIGTQAASSFGPAAGWAILAAATEVAMAGALVTSVVELVRRRP